MTSEMVIHAVFKDWLVRFLYAFLQIEGILEKIMWRYLTWFYWTLSSNSIELGSIPGATFVPSIVVKEIEQLCLY